VAKHQATSRDDGSRQSVSLLIWLFLSLILINIIGVILYWSKNNDGLQAEIVIVEIDTTGFIEYSVTLSSSQCLRIVNTTSYSAVV
jgi:hypothetical protein